MHQLLQMLSGLVLEAYNVFLHAGAYTTGNNFMEGVLVRDLGLVGELFRDDLLRKDEWWIPDLARRLGVITQKIHYWVKQGWISSRRTPSGKHWIVWADRAELRRLQQLATHKNSWIAARRPDLVIPKKRSTR